MLNQRMNYRKYFNEKLSLQNDASLWLDSLKCDLIGWNFSIKTVNEKNRKSS